MDNINMNNIMDQIKSIKIKLNQLQEELQEITVQGEYEQNLIIAIVSGTGEIIDYKFNLNEINNIDLKKLKDVLIKATNNGLKKAKQIEIEKKQRIIDNLNIPNIPGLF